MSVVQPDSATPDIENFEDIIKIHFRGGSCRMGGTGSRWNLMPAFGISGILYWDSLNRQKNSKFLIGVS
jgi:hypothetical protein